MKRYLLLILLSLAAFLPGWARTYTCGYCGVSYTSLSTMGSIKCDKSPDGHHDPLK